MNNNRVITITITMTYLFPSTLSVVGRYFFANLTTGCCEISYIYI